MSVDIANALKRLGHEVFFVVNKNIVEEKVDFEVYSLHRENSILNGEIPYALRLSEIIKSEKPNIVLAFMKAQTIILALSKILNPNKDTVYVGSIHNNDAYYKYGKAHYLPYRYLIKAIYEKLDYVLVPSKAVKEDLMKTFFVREDKFVIVPNCINFEKIERLSEESCDTQTDFINIGRLAEQKGQVYLLEAFKVVKEHFKDARLVIVGEGNLRKTLEAKIKEFGLENSVVLAGYQMNPYKYLKNSKIFVLSSLYEGFGNVLLEAMYLGLPVVSFDCPGGPKELLKDTKALAEAMIKLLENEELRRHYSFISKEKACEYGCEKYAMDLLSLLNS